MIKTILFITPILIALWLTGCWGYKAKQNKNNKANAEPEYEWGVAVNAPIGWLSYTVLWRKSRRNVYNR